MCINTVMVSENEMENETKKEDMSSVWKATNTAAVATYQL